MTSENSEIRPFAVAVEQAEIDHLRDRVSRTRWTGPQLPGWDRGVPTEQLQELVSYWTDGYDWRAHEARINSFPQYQTDIDGTTIHFLHVRSPHEDAFPLILTHGWPGTFVEYLAVIEELTNPADPADAFHVVIPSLPGMGFSGQNGGWDTTRTARAWATLMERLGYSRYGAAGNDAGSQVAPVLGAVADEVVAVHVTQVFAFPSGDPAEFEKFGEEEYRRLAFLQRFLDEHSGFNKLQSTRPETLAHALADSPAGQLAWILDLVRGFGDHPDDVNKALDADFVLTLASLYWFTNTGGSSARQYYENAHAAEDTVAPSTKPLGVAVFAADFPSIRPLAERDHNIVHWSEFERGGHYSGTDAPDLLAADLRTFFRTYR